MRVSARRVPEPARDLAAESAARLQTIRDERERVNREVLALFERDPSSQLYSVQVAEAVSCPVGTAKAALERLQAAGTLRSAVVYGGPCTSGNGRRYYSLAQGGT